MRLVITGGGTGGHVYPALAIQEALRKKEAIELLYVGTASGLEASIVRRAGLEFAGIDASALRGKALWTLPVALWRLSRGWWQAFRILATFRPSAVLATGGYVSAPVVLAAWVRRIPSLIYLPDAIPGLAVRFLACFANRIATSVEPSRRYLPASKVTVTGYPVRAGFGDIEQEEARRLFGLEPTMKTLLVLGGSRGAHSINATVATALEGLLSHYQILHITGAQDESWITERRSQLPKQLIERYRVCGYLEQEMPAAFAAANLIVCRAGASTLGELPAAGRPAILVPFPHAGRHQKANASVLVSAGAAVELADEDLEKLPYMIKKLLDDQTLLENMAARSKALAPNNAADHIAGLLLELTQPRKETVHG